MNKVWDTVWILTDSEYGDNLEILGVFSTEKLGLEKFNEKLEKEKSANLTSEIKYLAPTYVRVGQIEILLEKHTVEEEMEK